VFFERSLLIATCDINKKSYFLLRASASASAST
jgi:hypothetical protein